MPPWTGITGVAAVSGWYPPSRSSQRRRFPPGAGDCISRRQKAEDRRNDQQNSERKQRGIDAHYTSPGLCRRVAATDERSSERRHRGERGVI